MAPAVDAGVRTGVGVPVTVEGQLWGVIISSSTGDEPLPADTEARLAGFTELVGTAIANAQARVELRGYAEEQAAQRRLATLVARGVSPEKVFAAVTAEVGRVLGVDWGDEPVRAGRRADGRRRLVRNGSPCCRWHPGDPRRGERTRTGVRDHPAGAIDTTEGIGPARRRGPAVVPSVSVGVPITVEGQLWGIITVSSKQGEPLPAENRGAAGRIYRADRYRHRQRRGPGGP